MAISLQNHESRIKALEELDNKVKVATVWTGSSWAPTFTLPESKTWDNVLLVIGISSMSGVISGSLINKMKNGSTVLYCYDNDINVDYTAYFKKVNSTSGQFSMSSGEPWQTHPFTSVSVVYNG